MQKRICCSLSENRATMGKIGPCRPDGPHETRRFQQVFADNRAIPRPASRHRAGDEAPLSLAGGRAGGGVYPSGSVTSRPVRADS